MSDEGPRYFFKTSQTGLGIEHAFHGPGMPQHANGVHFLQPVNDWAAQCFERESEPDRSEYEAQRVRSLLGAAYLAGFAAAKAELRAWLETPKRQWGDPF